MDDTDEQDSFSGTLPKKKALNKPSQKSGKLVPPSTGLKKPTSLNPVKSTAQLKGLKKPMMYKNKEE